MSWTERFRRYTDQFVRTEIGPEVSPPATPFPSKYLRQEYRFGNRPLLLPECHRQFTDTSLDDLDSLSYTSRALGRTGNIKRLRKTLGHFGVVLGRESEEALDTLLSQTPRHPPTKQLFLGWLSHQDQRIKIECEEENVEVEFLSRKYRFCKKKVVERKSLSLKKVSRSTVSLLDRDQDIANKNDGQFFRPVEFSTSIKDGEYTLKNKMGQFDIMFLPSFDIQHFLMLNTNTPFPLFIPALARQSIEPIDVLTSKIEAYFRSEISSTLMMLDISFYYKMWQFHRLDLPNLIERLECTLAEPFSETTHFVESPNIQVFAYLKTLMRVHSFYDDLKVIKPCDSIKEQEYSWNLRDNRRIRKNSVEPGWVSFSEELREEDVRTLSAKVVENIKNIKNISGSLRIFTLWQNVGMYRRRGIFPSNQFLQMIVDGVRIKKSFMVSAVMLLGRMHLSIPEGIEYASFQEGVAFRFQEALAKELRAGNDLGELFRAVEWIAKADNTCEGKYRSYGFSRIVYCTEAVFIRRIEKVRSLEEFEKIEAGLRIAAKSLVSFKKVFSVLEERRSVFLLKRLL